MVNELKSLLRETAADAPPDVLDAEAVLRGGRARVRRRRWAVAGGGAVVAAAVVAGSSLVWPAPPDLDAAGVPAPAAPTLQLADAREAVAGRDYEILASHTNENLDRDNGQYFDGVTDDGLVLFRDGPRLDQMRTRYALLDPATGERDWLPESGVEQTQTVAVELSEDRLVLLGVEGRSRLTAWVFDRARRTWTTTTWPGLPRVDFPRGSVGPDGRLYLGVAGTRGAPPPGGWPTGPDGEADDADAAGDTYRLVSVSLTDAADVRDEELVVGDVAFTDSAMVWTDATNGDSGRVHVRDLTTGEERAFDPRSGERCNLLSFGATRDRVVLGQYCGTYADGVRDDRVQVLSTDGDQVVTLQDHDIDGGLVGSGDVVTVRSYQRGLSGTYVYDLETDRFLRLSDAVSGYTLGGPTPAGHVLWDEPVNLRRGAEQHVGRLAD